MTKEDAWKRSVSAILENLKRHGFDYRIRKTSGLFRVESSITGKGIGPLHKTKSGVLKFLEGCEAMVEVLV